ncbi:hypothetical protein ACFFJY_03180 [Fictibacillus aquaticus]|uniref:Uncharacterized protein n=1 Tax=Fictibacillus aquaticus TaxID=2021314 RepID=A0A235F8R3_9BACL|nr:hypothetical protein CGZ90_13635 [Fictibacillus aquaticus]
MQSRAEQAAVASQMGSLGKGALLLAGSGGAASAVHHMDFTADDHSFHDDQFDQMNHMHDPYINPGVDIVVDESYHGIDHGMGIANPDTNNHHF